MRDLNSQCTTIPSLKVNLVKGFCFGLGVSKASRKHGKLLGSHLRKQFKVSEIIVKKVGRPDERIRPEVRSSSLQRNAGRSRRKARAAIIGCLSILFSLKRFFFFPCIKKKIFSVQSQAPFFFFCFSYFLFQFCARL